MLADPLLISPDKPTALATNQVSFGTVSVKPDGVERLNIATDLSLPEKLSIKHNNSGTAAAGNVVDRHLISTSRVEADSAGKQHTCTVNLTIAVPRNGLFSTAEVERQVALLANLLLTTGNVAKILQNQA